MNGASDGKWQGSKQDWRFWRTLCQEDNASVRSDWSVCGSFLRSKVLLVPFIYTNLSLDWQIQGPRISNMGNGKVRVSIVLRRGLLKGFSKLLKMLVSRACEARHGESRAPHEIQRRLLKVLNGCWNWNRLNLELFFRCISHDHAILYDACTTEQAELVMWWAHATSGVWFTTGDLGLSYRHRLPVYSCRAPVSQRLHESWRDRVPTWSLTMLQIPRKSIHATLKIP